MSNILSAVSAVMQQTMAAGPRDDERAVELVEKLSQQLDDLANDPSNPAGKMLQDARDFVKANGGTPTATQVTRPAARFAPAVAAAPSTNAVVEVPTTRPSQVWVLNAHGVLPVTVGEAAAEFPLPAPQMAHYLLSRTSAEYWHLKADGVTQFAVNFTTRQCEPVRNLAKPEWAEMLVDASKSDRVAIFYFSPKGNMALLANKTIFEQRFAQKVRTRVELAQ